MAFVGVIESALHEMQSFAGKTTGEPKYSLDQLLEEEYRLPRPLTHKEKEAGVGGALMAMAGQAQARKPEAQDAKQKPYLPANLLRQLKERGVVA